MQMALVLCLFLALSWGGGRPFELQEAIEELQSENARLQGKIQNLTEALSELRLFVWNRSQAGGDADALNWCLTTTMDWMRANKMKLSPGKTAKLLVGGSLDRMEGSESTAEHLLREQVPCHADQHQRNSAHLRILPAPLWLFAALLLMALLLKIAG